MWLNTTVKNKKDPPCLATRGQQHTELKGTSKNKNLSGCKKHWWVGEKKRRREREREGGVPLSTVKVVCFWKENGSWNNNGQEREREREWKKKRLDKKERTTKKNGLLRSLSRPHNSLSKNLRQSKPPLNGTPRQTGLARTATRATGLKNGQQPRVRATPYWPHHGNREGEGKEEGEGEQPLLDAARLFEVIQAACRQPLPRVQPITLLYLITTTYSSTKASRPSLSRQFQITDTHESF